MNANEFVNAVRSVVRDAAVEDVVSLLERPPGRRPADGLTALSQWFNGLDEATKQRVQEVAAMASHHATFGMLAVIDGVRIIEDGASRSALELRYVRDAESTVLNDPAGPFLHDLLQQV